MLNLLFLVAVALFAAAMIRQLLETGGFINRLKSHHPRTYEALGSPRWRIHFGDPSYRETIRFIRERQFTHLEDEALESFYRGIKSADRLAIAAAAGAVVVTLLQVLTGQ